MTGTNLTDEQLQYREQLAEEIDSDSDRVLLRYIRSLQQQVTMLQHQLVVQTKSAEIGAKNLIVAEQQVNTLKNALEDVADYQHRWSDSPIFEVQKIARKALQSIKESPREEQT